MRECEQRCCKRAKPSGDRGSVKKVLGRTKKRSELPSMAVVCRGICVVVGGCGVVPGVSGKNFAAYLGIKGSHQRIEFSQVGGLGPVFRLKRSDGL